MQSRQMESYFEQKIVSLWKLWEITFSAMNLYIIHCVAKHALDLQAPETVSSAPGSFNTYNTPYTYYMSNCSELSFHLISRVKH